MFMPLCCFPLARRNQETRRQNSAETLKGRCILPRRVATRRQKRRASQSDYGESERLVIAVSSGKENQPSTGRRSRRSPNSLTCCNLLVRCGKQVTKDAALLAGSVGSPTERRVAERVKVSESLSSLVAVALVRTHCGAKTLTLLPANVIPPKTSNQQTTKQPTNKPSWQTLALNHRFLRTDLAHFPQRARLSYTTSK